MPTVPFPTEEKSQMWWVLSGVKGVLLCLCSHLSTILINPLTAVIPGLYGVEKSRLQVPVSSVLHSLSTCQSSYVNRYYQYLAKLMTEMNIDSPACVVMGINVTCRATRFSLSSSSSPRSSAISFLDTHTHGHTHTHTLISTVKPCMSHCI